LEGVQLATISPSQKISLFSQPSAWLLEIYDISGILNFISMNILLVRRWALDISREQKQLEWNGFLALRSLEIKYLRGERDLGRY